MKPHVYIPGDEKLCGWRAAEFGEWCRQPKDHEIHRWGHKKFGQGAAITCPFGPHGGTVHVRGEGANTLIERHDMGFDLLHPEMMCPASWMHWPLGDAEKSALAQQAKDMAAQFRRDIEEDAETWEVAQPIAESQFIKHQGRMGREPEPTSDDWALGGREDEDVPHHDDVVAGVVPSDVHGEQIGRNGMIDSGVVTSRFTVERTEAVITGLNEVQATLQACSRSVAELLGDGNGETLTNWLNTLRAMIEDIDPVIRKAHQANAYGNQFIKNITS